MNMIKLAMASLTLLFAGTMQMATAQTSVNNITVTNSASAAPTFIDGISFTPDGILKTTASGGTKSIKTIPALVVTKKKPVTMEVDNSLIEQLSPLQFKYAMMMDVDVESLKNVSLLGFIDDWFGTRYRYGGTTKRGIDCSALTETLLLAVYGFNVPRTARQQYNSTEHIKKDELEEGDLVFFNTHGGVSHVGLYLDNNYFLHASTHGVKISSLDDKYYAKRFICGGRIIEKGVAQRD